MIFTSYAELLTAECVFRAQEYGRSGFPIEVRVPEREAEMVRNPSSDLVHTLATTLLTALLDGRDSREAAREELDRLVADPDANAARWGAAVPLARALCDLPLVARHT